MQISLPPRVLARSELCPCSIPVESATATASASAGANRRKPLRNAVHRARCGRDWVDDGVDGGVEDPVEDGIKDLIMTAISIVFARGYTRWDRNRACGGHLHRADRQHRLPTGH